MWGVAGTLLCCWWECKLEQSLWKKVWQFPKKKKKLNTDLPYDPAILFLGIYPRKRKPHVYTKNWAQTFSAALPVTAKSWKKSMCPSTEEWRNKRWHGCHVPNRDKEQTIDERHSVDEMWQNITPHERSQTQKSSHYMIPFIWNSRIDKNNWWWKKWER